MFQNRGLNHVAPPAPARRGAPSSVDARAQASRSQGGETEAAASSRRPSRFSCLAALAQEPTSHLGINGILEPTKQTGLARRVPAGGRPPPTCPLPYERARSLPARVPDGARHADERVLGEGSGSLRLRSAVARNARALLRRGWTAFRLQSGVDGK